MGSNNAKDLRDLTSAKSESFSTRTELQPGGLPTVILSRSRRSRSTSWGSYKARPHGKNSIWFSKNSKWSKSRLFRWQNTRTRSETHTAFPLTQTGATLAPRAAPRRHQSHWLANALQRVPAMRFASFCFMLFHLVRLETKLVFASWMKLFRG